MTHQRTRKPGRGQRPASKAIQKAKPAPTKPSKPEREPCLVDRLRSENERHQRVFEEAEGVGKAAQTQAMIDAMQKSGFDFKNAMLEHEVMDAAMLRGRDYKGVGSRHDIWTTGDALAASLTGRKTPPNGESLAKATLLQIHSELRALATVLGSRHCDDTQFVDLSDVASSLRGIAGRAKAAADFSRRYADANRAEVKP